MTASGRKTPDRIGSAVASWLPAPVMRKIVCQCHAAVFALLSTPDRLPLVF
jgi:hypothetical protein